MTTISPVDASAMSERSAYAEGGIPGQICAGCTGPVMVQANYNDLWRTPVTMAPLRIEDLTGVIMDGGARTQGLPSFGLQDGQSIDGVRPELGYLEMNEGQRGPVSVMLIPDPAAEQEVANLEATILADIESFARSSETALIPWIDDWQNSSWWDLFSDFFEGVLTGLGNWWEGEGEFWSSVGDWISNLPEMVEAGWDNLTGAVQAMWENRHRIIGLLQSLAEGAVSAFQAGFEALRDVFASIPSLSEIADILTDLVDNSAEWAGAMIEMVNETRVIKVLGATMLGTIMMIPPNFWAEMAGTVGGYLIPEVIISILFAILAAFTGGTGGAALAARLSAFVARTTARLARAGRAGPALLRVFNKLIDIIDTLIDLAKALKRKIVEVAEGVTDRVVQITRRSGRRVDDPADIPCFNRPPNATNEDFLTQLREQEAAINNSDLSELARRRALVVENGTGALRDRAAQQAVRTQWLADRTLEIVEDGFLESEAAAMAASEAASLDATHALDIVAGGNPSDISGMQSSAVNRSLGPQWNGNRVNTLDEAIASQIAQGADKAHVRLRPC